MSNFSLSLNIQIEKSFIELLAYAIIAHRRNGNRYVKSNYYGKLVNSSNTPNISIVKKLLTENHQLDDADLDAAEKIKAHIDGYVLDIIKDTKNRSYEFKSRILNLANKSSLHPTDLGLICFIPEMYKNDVHSDEIAEKIMGTNDSAIGKDGDTVSLTINIIESKHIPMTASYKFTAITSDNQTIMFYTRDHKEKISGTNVKIRARVKETTKDQNGTLVTRLNYVKTI